MSDFTEEQKKIVRLLAKRRVFIFIFGVTVVAFISAVTDEAGYLPYALDDFIVVPLALIAVIFLGVTWRRQSLSSLKMSNNVMLVLSVIYLVLGIMAVVIEIKDPSMVADDFPKIIISLTLLINRFV